VVTSFGTAFYAVGLAIELVHLPMRFLMILGTITDSSATGTRMTSFFIADSAIFSLHLSKIVKKSEKCKINKIQVFKNNCTTW